MLAMESAARRMARLAMWVSVGRAMGVMAMTLAPTSAAPAVTYGRTAACMMPLSSRCDVMAGLNILKNVGNGPERQIFKTGLNFGCVKFFCALDKRAVQA